MNHMTYPYMPNVPNQYPTMPQNQYPAMPQNQYSNMPQNQGIEEEIRKIKIEIRQLKEKIAELEKKDTKNYLQKEDGFYMM